MKKIKKILGWIIVSILATAILLLIFSEYKYLGVLVVCGCIFAGGLLALAINWIKS